MTARPAEEADALPDKADDEDWCVRDRRQAVNQTKVGVGPALRGKRKAWPNLGGFSFVVQGAPTHGWSDDRAMSPHPISASWNSIFGRRAAQRPVSRGGEFWAPRKMAPRIEIYVRDGERRDGADGAFRCGSSPVGAVCEGRSTGSHLKAWFGRDVLRLCWPQAPRDRRSHVTMPNVPFWPFYWLAGPCQCSGHAPERHPGHVHRSR